MPPMFDFFQENCASPAVGQGPEFAARFARRTVAAHAGLPNCCGKAGEASLPHRRAAPLRTPSHAHGVGGLAQEWRAERSIQPSRLEDLRRA